MLKVFRNSGCFWKEVVVDEVSLDMVCAAFLLGVTRKEKISFRLPSEKDMADERTLCIGAGRLFDSQKSNFGLRLKKEGEPFNSVTRSVADEADWMSFLSRVYGDADCFVLGASPQDLERRIQRLYSYVDLQKTMGAEVIKTEMQVLPPTLADVFSSMLVLEPNLSEQFFKGIEILAEVVRKGFDPFGTVRVFGYYQAAQKKTEDERLVAEDLKKARWFETEQGRKFAIAESEQSGTKAALLREGADIAVVFLRVSPGESSDCVISGRGFRIDKLLLEPALAGERWARTENGFHLTSILPGTALNPEQIEEAIKRLF